MAVNDKFKKEGANKLHNDGLQGKILYKDFANVVMSQPGLIVVEAQWLSTAEMEQFLQKVISRDKS